MKRPPFFLIFFINSALFSLWSFLTFRTEVIRRWDSWIYGTVSSFRSSSWLELNAAVSFLGRGEWLLFLAVLLGLYLLFFHHGGLKSFWPLVSLLLIMRITVFFKVCFSVPRPSFFDARFTWPGFSYPSGHSSESLLFYGILAWVASKLFAEKRWSKRITGGSVVLVLMIGLSRIFLGAHWMSDVVGGFLLGAAWLFLNLMLAERFFFRPAPVSSS